MKKLLIAILLLSPIIGLSQENKQEPSKIEQTVQTQTQKNKDVFLNFVMEKAEKYSEKGEQALGKAIDIASKEAPILVEEYLVWNFWKNLLDFLIPVSLFVCFGTSGYFILKKADYDDRTWNVAATFSIILGFCTLGSFIALCVNMSNLLTAIQVSIAPRVFILEQLINIVK